MEALVGKLTPMENKIIELRAKMQPIYDDVSVLRKDMVDECIHPFDLLIHKGTYVDCKFCGKKLAVKNQVVTGGQIDSSELPIADWAK